jgi:hypothetical protein
MKTQINQPARERTSYTKEHKEEPLRTRFSNLTA